MDGFAGFGPKALPFLKALAFHQTKAWFDENRALYESDVVGPMVALLDGLTADFAKRKLPLRAEGRRSMFRLNRDVRFSKDKSPYKTHAGAVMTRSGGKKEQGLLYIHVDPKGSFVAAGFYMPEAHHLAALRRAILAAPARAEKLVATLGRSGLALGTFDQLTRIPRGFEALKDGPLDPVIRMKSLIVEEKVADDVVTAPAFATTVADFAKRARPLLDFGWDALG